MNLPPWEQDVATVQPVISEPLTTQLAAQSQTDQPKQECDSRRCFITVVAGLLPRLFSRLRGAVDGDTD